MIRKLFHIILLALVAVSCDGDIFCSSEPMLVIDGYIEDGGFPVVIVTTTLPVSDRTIGEEELRDCVARWAKVTVSDGEKEVILTGMVNRKYFPSYIYTTGDMRGHVGKTYRLEVEYHGMKATAVTTIPESGSIQNIEIQKSRDSDSRYFLEASFHRSSDPGSHYGFFVRQESDGVQYKPSFLGLVDDFADRWTVYPPQPEKWSNLKPYFVSGSVVDVKLCSMDEECFRYWESFTALSSMSGNVLVPFDDNLVSNIRGGEGIWAGYGSDVYRVVIP